jgi:peptidoglycan-N-acetylglucosamine deacetylase
MHNPLAGADPPLPIASSRKILCAAALAASALLALPSTGPAATSRGALLQRADLSQAGKDLILTVRTARPVALAKLQARPDPRRAGARYLCVGFGHALVAGERWICLGGAKAHRRIGVETVGAGGRPTRIGSIAAKVKRPSADKLVVALEPADAGLSPRRYRWRVLTSSGCKVPRRCVEMLPAQGLWTFRLRPVRAVGCTGGSAGLLTNGPRDRKVVALTFDDGPSEYTPEFLRVLREKGVHGTFFEVGQEMSGREDVMRQILAEGNEIGDHTVSHVEYPGYAQIAGAASLIRSYTHFQPCLFRPPGGAVNSGVIATAGSLGMRTINWDVDPRDWSTPGTGAIYSNVVANAQPGSIILMHDGGGPRGETLAALPQVIENLRGRGYRFATVSELLGYKILYRPYG